MPTLRWKLLPLGLLLGMTLATLAARSVVLGQDGGGPGVVPAPPQGSVSDEPPEVRLSEVRANPVSWIGQRVRFVLQLEGLKETWNPFLTRFGAGDWVAVSGWSDERFTWDPEVHADPLRRLFLRRGSAVHALAAQARPYERLEIEATVREVFLDDPWLEVHALAVLSAHVPEGTILHVSRARDFMLRGQWDLALQQYDRAMAAPLPAHARQELAKQVEACSTRRDAMLGVAREAAATQAD